MGEKISGIPLDEAELEGPCVAQSVTERRNQHHRALFQRFGRERAATNGFTAKNKSVVVYPRSGGFVASRWRYLRCFLATNRATGASRLD